MHFDAEFFVALGFLLLVLLFGYLGVHSKIAAALDRRGAQVAAELAEAQRLRQEAEKVLASFASKAHEAEAEAEAIIRQAKAEAEALAKEAAARVADFISRRTAQAESKIALAEAQAAAEVRAAAADAAVAAAEIVLKAEVKGSTAAELLASSIDEIGGRLKSAAE